MPRSPSSPMFRAVHQPDGSGGGSDSRASPPHDGCERGGVDPDGGARDGDGDRNLVLELAQQPQAGELPAAGGHRAASTSTATVSRRAATTSTACARAVTGGSSGVASKAAPVQSGSDGARSRASAAW